MKVQVTFDVACDDPIFVLKALQYQFVDGEVSIVIQDTLNTVMVDAKVEVLEFVPKLEPLMPVPFLGQLHDDIPGGDGYGSDD